MSVRYLYRVLSVSKRICSYWRCQAQILRNMTKTEDGRLWHYGCLNDARDESYRCQECGSTLDGTEVSLADLADGLPILACGNCGATLKMHSNFRVVMKIGNL